MISHLPIKTPTYQLDNAGVPLHHQAVTIIVCAHNALTDVQLCLESIADCSTSPYSLIIVDDGSNQETCDYLSRYTNTFSATLLRNETARGYTCAANQGLQVAHTDYVILLNSDTIVTPYWLDRMIACAESDTKIGIVSPLSNTASWQSIPQLENKGDWATNPLPLDLSVTQMGNRIAAHSTRLYPRLPFLNGFCLLIKRQLIEKNGYFDEVTFAQGYGEENDYCLRARQAGWELAVADDVYIYHAQSKSYSHDRRQFLAEQAGMALARKHGQATIDAGVQICRYNRVLQGIRVRAQLLLERWHLVEQGQYHWHGKRVVFMLPLREISGGGNVIITEARAMRRMGVDAVILNFLHHQVDFERCYPNLDVPVIYSPTDFDIPRFCAGFDAVIATANHSVEWIAPLAHQPNPPIIAYYIQDFEPYFHIEKPTRFKLFWQSAWLRRRAASYYFRKDAGFRRAWLSYLRVPNMLCFTKTTWNKAEVEKQVKKPCTVIGASCDVDLFMPRIAEKSTEQLSKIRISAMIRPSSSRRGALRTMQVLRQIQHAYSEQVDIILFGVANDDPQFLALPRDFVYQNLGLQTSAQIAGLFAQIDVFVDFSTFQAMGLTAMEAMAAGVAVIVPKWGGTDSFAIHQHNALVIDTTVYQTCYSALETLVTQLELRKKLMNNALQEIARFYPEKPAYHLLELLFRH